MVMLMWAGRSHILIITLLWFLHAMELCWSLYVAEEGIGAEEAFVTFLKVNWAAYAKTIIREVYVNIFYLLRRWFASPAMCDNPS